MHGGSVHRQSVFGLLLTTRSDEIGDRASEQRTGVNGVRPRKNNNQSDERQVREPANYAVSAVPCVAVSLGRERRGQTELPTAFNSPPPVPAIMTQQLETPSLYY